jgi:hypothetical protein
MSCPTLDAAMSDSPDEVIVLDLWTVPEEDRDEFMDAMVTMFEQMRELDGFIEGQILRGANPSLFATYARVRTAAERDAAMIDPRIQAVLRRLREIAEPKPHAYTVARTFSAPSREQPAA